MNLAYSLIDMSANQTLVSYFSFESISGPEGKEWLNFVYYYLGRLQTDPGFIFWLLFIFIPDLIDSSRTFFAENATLVCHLLSSCSLF